VTEVRDARGYFEGFDPRECGEHRTVGTYRAWCHDCAEWCYPSSPCVRCELPVLRAELERLRAEPVLAPNALDASAERWQLYAAQLEGTLGELRGERDRLRAALKRSVAEAELRWSGKHMSDDELTEFADHVARPWPPTSGNTSG